jgi:beta-xylosidase
MDSASINPIIPGFAPDPSCTRIGDTYYLVNSTFGWYPGLPIYASKDLVNWRHVTNAINRPSQLSFARSYSRVHPPGAWDESMTAAGGLYAPTIRERDGIVYVVCTNIINGLHKGDEDVSQNFYVTTKNIESGEWSDPIFYDFKGIDTCIFWDDDGRSYIHGSGQPDPPGPMTHIKLFEIDLKTGQKLTEEKGIWGGTGGVYPEGPHLYKKDGFYYLLISEGGCFPAHMITVARSRDLWGPYEAYENNPISTARGTDEYIQHIGHSDLFQDAQDKWWAVCLGVRKDKQGRYLMGRETFLSAVDWPEGGWPSIRQVRMTPELHDTHTLRAAPSGQLPAVDGADLLYIHDPDLSKHSLSQDCRTIILTTSPADITAAGPEDKPTFVGKRMRALTGISTMALDLTAGSSATSIKQSPANIRAGLTIFKDEHRFARIYYDSSDNKAHYEVLNKAKSISTRSSSAPVDETTKQVHFAIEATESNLSFSFRSVAGQEGKGDSIELASLDTKDLTGLDFVGPVIGVFAVSDAGGHEVTFRDLVVQ